MDGIILHSVNVAYYSVQIYRYEHKLFLSGLLHDSGKQQIPGYILNKKSALTKNDFEIIKQHPVEGAQILTRKNYDYYIIKTVLYHHERWDGNGYPEGLEGTNIPLYSRILAVADAFDAMTSPRPYREGFSFEHAIKELEENAGTQFDPYIVEEFLKLYEKIFNIRSNANLGQHKPEKIEVVYYNHKHLR